MEIYSFRKETIADSTYYRKIEGLIAISVKICKFEMLLLRILYIYFTILCPRSNKCMCEGLLKYIGLINIKISKENPNVEGGSERRLQINQCVLELLKSYIIWKHLRCKSP